MREDIQSSQLWFGAVAGTYHTPYACLMAGKLLLPRRSKAQLQKINKEVENGVSVASGPAG